MRVPGADAQAVAGSSPSGDGGWVSSRPEDTCKSLRRCAEDELLARRHALRRQVCNTAQETGSRHVSPRRSAWQRLGSRTRQAGVRIKVSNNGASSTCSVWSQGSCRKYEVHRLGYIRARIRPGRVHAPVTSHPCTSATTTRLFVRPCVQERVRSCYNDATTAVTIPARMTAASGSSDAWNDRSRRELTATGDQPSRYGIPAAQLSAFVGHAGSDGQAPCIITSRRRNAHS